MDWEPQTHEFVNHDGSTILVEIGEDGLVEVTYFDYDTIITEHVTAHWADTGHIYSASVTRIQPGRHLPSTPAL